ncbi:Hypothetical predicted protein, partial [Paramuricea clavata]
MVLINRKTLIKLVMCQLTCSLIIWISTKPLCLNHLQDLRLIKPRYDNLPTQIKYQTTINSTIKIKRARAPTNFYYNSTASFRPTIQLMHDIELNPGPTNQTHENGCFDLPKKTKGLIIGHLNIRSIKCATKLDEIKALLIRKPTIHVISFSETWLNDSWPDDMLYIPNYTFIRLDRSSNTSGGGIITYIHNDVPFTHRSDLGSENIESTCIEIKPHYVSPILLLNVYRPPSADSSHDYCLTEILERVASENKECYFLGDFNMNVLCQKSKSSVFLKRIHQLGLKQLVTVPTRTEARYVNGSFSVTSTLIDHIYCSSERNVASIHVPPLSLSDHYPVFLVRRCNASMRSKQNEKSTIQYRSLSNLNKTDFREDLRLAPWSSIEAFDDPSDALALWYEIFQSVVERHAPLRTKRVKSLQLLKWMTPEILSDIKKRDQLKTKARNGTISWETFRSCRNRISFNIKQAKKNYFAHEILQNKHDSRKLWKLMKEAGNLNSNKTTPNEIIDNGVSVTNPAIIAQLFNSHFSQIADSVIHDTTHHEPNLEPLRQFVKTRLPDNHHFTVPVMSAEYLLNAINNLSCNKAKGVDSINIHLLQVGCNEVLPSLLYIYNTSITSGIFPDQWKISKITPVFKKGSRQNKDNYRPIA